VIAYCRVVEVLHSGNRTAALETVGCVPVLHSSDWKTMGILFIWLQLSAKSLQGNGHWAVGFNVRVCGTGKMHWKSDSAGAAESGGSPTAVRSYGCSAVQTGRLSEQSNLRLLQTVNVLKTNIHSNETKVIDHFQFSRKVDDDAAFPNRPGRWTSSFQRFPTVHRQWRRF